MTKLVALAKRLSTRFPGIEVSVDQAETDDGTSYLDVTLDDQFVVVQLNPRSGYGVSTPSEDEFGTGPDEVFANEDSAFDRVRTLLISRTKASGPTKIDLRDLRNLQDLSQVELARLLGVNQATISKMERKPDVLVSTLRRLVSKLGGRLEIRACLPGGVYNLVVADKDDW